MVRGAKIKLRVSLKSSNGEPTPDSLVNDIKLSLYSTADKTSIAKSVSVGSGVTKESDGVYLIEIAETDTIKLPKTGTALLEGWLLPARKKVVFKLGQIKDNVKNG